jgi:hypothetical protein
MAVSRKFRGAIARSRNKHPDNLIRRVKLRALDRETLRAGAAD